VLNPYVPEQWQSYTFRIKFQGATMRVAVTREAVLIHNPSSEPVEVQVQGTRKSVVGENRFALRELVRQ